MYEVIALFLVFFENEVCKIRQDELQSLASEEPRVTSGRYKYSPVGLRKPSQLIDTNKEM
jgi:hypothetical protein